MRINPQLFQYRSSQSGTNLAGNCCYPSAILDSGMASLAFAFIYDDIHIGLPRELAELTNKIVLVRQGGNLSGPTYSSYFFVRMSNARAAECVGL
jgi:hypothetical protein